jgi:protease-4
MAQAKDKDDDKRSDAKATETTTIIPVFRLHGELTETPRQEVFPLAAEQSHSLKEVLERMKKAQEDEAVKAVIIIVSDLAPGWAQIEELRGAIVDLRSHGKDVFAYADSLTMPQYVLLSGATRLSVVPTGDLWLTGLMGESLHVRSLLDKIGVKPDFLTCGAYKSAAELFMRSSPSKEADEMTNWLLDSLYDTSVKQIARGRGVSTDKVKDWINHAPYSAGKARDAGIIDAVEHRQDFEAGVKNRFGGTGEKNTVKLDTKYGHKSHSQIDLSSPLGIFNFYAELLGGKKTVTHRDSVAIVYVEGPIVLGSVPPSLFDPDQRVAASTPLRAALNKAADDDTIKAVVLRVNSPGGSAVASEVILHATERVKAKKPLVVSMSNVAGSGGYYVACGSDTIFADEGTITGSIGVVAGKLATRDMFNKLGITWKEYTRGENAGLLSTDHPFTDEERQKMQSWMDEIYEVFKKHVTDIRGKRLKKPIDELAGGRVYTGRQALDLGLVDKIGTLEDAVKFAAKEAKLEKYELRVVPEPKSFIDLLLEGTSGDSDDDNVALGALPGKAGLKPQLLDAALPALRGLDPQRAKSLLRAIEQLDVLHREGAVLMTPELLVR